MSAGKTLATDIINAVPFKTSRSLAKQGIINNFKIWLKRKEQHEHELHILPNDD